MFYSHYFSSLFMQIIKKILTLQLLAALLLTQVGYYFFYMQQQNEIKESVRQKIFSNLTDTTFFIVDANTKNIIWEEAEKECSIDGKMYDVAKIKIINNKKYFYCLNDDKEDNLLKEYSKQINSQTESNKHQKNGKLSIKFQTIALENINNFVAATYLINVKNAFPIFGQKAIKTSISLIFPPPKV